jgi:DNA-binding NtrC family response regulator
MKLPLILLIDDEPLVAKTVEMLVKNAGFDVLVATSVAAAIDAWDAHHCEIKLVITDWALGQQTNGEQLVERFRAKSPNLKSILCSAYPLQRLSTQRTEGIDYFQKPMTGSELIAAVRRALQGY